jgi:hypothetical protein
MTKRERDHAAVLDRIIEKYTATPRNDPELVNYSLQPSRRKRRSSRRGRGAVVSQDKKAAS